MPISAAIFHGAAERIYWALTRDLQLLKLTGECLHAAEKLGRVGRNMMYKRK